MFRKVLIANRGEIACRIIRTCRRLSIPTVAVFSEADRDAQHVRRADEALPIGPAPARESYLVIERIIEAARRSGADAIHPGYGFLSERAEFAEACAAAGIAFIGPPAGAIRAMGLKGAAKALMVQAGVPVVPGYHGDDQAPANLLREAEKIGWPVLIKAVAGGGGKGMRRVESASDFAAALEGAKREAAAAFGDDKVLIEKYLLKPRHIEIQVFADGHGNAVHLFERDCSVQRRHQKVIEEAPAPGMTDGMRAAMGKAAVAAARAVGYVGAGTVEFIADVADGLRDDRFYFMEMNTRLQVEHPVTEAVTGQDLVEWQLRVATGETLPLQQDDLAIHGHAVEVRLYAEDPARGFLPSIGRLLRLHLPDDAEGIRVDRGVVEGDLVSPHYDPMIAKVIAHGADRDTSLRRLAAALDRVELAGLQSNAAFLARCLRQPAFAVGDVDTGFIDRHSQDLVPAAMQRDDVLAAAAFLLAARLTEAGGNPWGVPAAWRMNLPACETVLLDAAGKRVDVGVEHLATGWRLALDARSATVVATLRGDGHLDIVIDEVPVRYAALRDGDALWLMQGGRTLRFDRHDPLDDVDVQEGVAGAVFAPMPGKIIRVEVNAGASVRRGQALLVLEAMKMEHTIAAVADGVIEQVAVTVGDQVADGALLAVLAAGE
jgi:3-methylcrotonyl-CoA carboxylase alpha subunit